MLHPIPPRVLALRALLALLAVLALPAPSRAQAKLYPAPAGVDSSPDFSVQVDGQPCFVYRTRVNNSTSWSADPATVLASLAYFDFAGSVTVTVTARKDLAAGLDIRPSSAGITASIQGNRATFKLDRPRKLSLEFRDPDLAPTPLFLFADSTEANIPKAGDPGVVYFGPGVHEAGAIKVRSGQTVYLAGGSVVRGHIYAVGARDFRIRGRGILDGGRRPRIVHDTAKTVMLERCKNAEVNGIVILDSPLWMVHTVSCQGLGLRDLKLVGARANSDGFDLELCRNVRVEDCFLREWDDDIALKAFHSRLGPCADRIADQGSLPFTREDCDSLAKWPDQGLVPYLADIQVRRCVLWNNWAEPIETGAETQADSIVDVLWEDIDVIHASHNTMISIHNDDGAKVARIRYRNIRAEQVSCALFAFNSGQGDWAPLTPDRMRMLDLAFDNLSVALAPDYHGTPGSSFAGNDATHAIDGVTFRNFRLNGKVITAAKDANISLNPYVYRFQMLPDSAVTVMKNITGITSSGGPAPGARAFRDASGRRAAPAPRAVFTRP